MKRYFFGIVWFMMINFGCVVLASGLSMSTPAEDSPQKPALRSPDSADLAQSKLKSKKTITPNAYRNKFVYKYGGLIIILSAIAATVGTATGYLPGTAEHRSKPQE